MGARGWHHTPEARARIGAAAKARKSSAIAIEARWARHRAARALLPPKAARKRLTPEEKRANNIRRAKEWSERNPDRRKAIKRKSFEKNRERLNAKQREQNKTPERKAFIRIYAPKHRAANPDKYATYSENRRARELGAVGSHTEAEWIAKVRYCGNACVYCQSKFKLSRDHDIPLARGGSNYISNIVPACSSCNSAKGTLTGDEFRNRLNGGVTMDPRWASQLANARKSRQCSPSA